jgi:hypothetical protein
MKIVGFEADGGLRLGIVEGDQVVDLQAADPNLPTDLRVILQKNNGELAMLGDIAKRAPASARRPLKGLKYALPVANPGAGAADPLAAVTSAASPRATSGFAGGPSASPPVRGGPGRR